MLKSACWLELPLAGIHLFSPILYNNPFPVLRSFFGVSQRIAGERKELFAKIQKELFQQTIAVRGRPGFYGSTGLPSWPKNVFSRPGLCAASQFSAYPVRFWALNFRQFGQNSPHTLIRTHWWRSWSPLDDSRLRFRVIGKKPSHVPILRCEYSVARATLVLQALHVIRIILVCCTSLIFFAIPTFSLLDTHQS